MASGPLQIQVLDNGVGRHLALTVPAMAALVGEENFKTLTHLRSSILKNVKATWPLGSNAQRFVAASIKRWGVKGTREAVTIEDAVGRAIAFPVRDVDPTRGGLEAAETGRTVSAPGMWIPFAAMRQGSVAGRAIAMRRFRVDLRAGLLIRIPGTPWVVKREGRTRSQIVAKVMDSRNQRAILKFHETFKRIWPERQAKYAKLAEMALTVAGRKALEKKRVNMLTQRDEWRKVYGIMLASGANRSEARDVAKAAAKMARSVGGNA